MHMACLQKILDNESPAEKLLLISLATAIIFWRAAVFLGFGSFFSTLEQVNNACNCHRPRKRRHNIRYNTADANRIRSRNARSLRRIWN
jgi:hypothetical protein